MIGSSKTTEKFIHFVCHHGPAPAGETIRSVSRLILGILFFEQGFDFSQQFLEVILPVINVKKLM